MSDLISRQAALDEMTKRFQEWLALFGYDSYEVANDRIKLVCDGIMKGMEAVMDLPSAQPEVIYCKDCKYYTSVTARCEVRGKGLYLIRGMEDFCSRAERRTDG